MEEPASALNQNKVALPIDYFHEEGALRPDTRQRNVIRPLPDDVISQIRSSATINSLNDVVFGLMQNSLDASSTRVEVVVDFKRGNCTIEDDGHGIPLCEFVESGGLGKPYHTSKHNAEPYIYGQHGLFLSAVGSVSFLTVHSRRRKHRSTNGLTIHQSSVIARHTPAPPSEWISTQSSGTRVAVRNLFGNMPVRVKHRGRVMEDASERNRAWQELKRTTLALLLAFRRPISLTLREVNGELDLKLTLKSPADVPQQLAHDPLHLSKTWVNPLLLNAGLVEHDSHDTWISVGASSHTISVTGLVSLRPAPSRYVQFISIGNVPILPRHSNHELYHCINAIFDRSDFGAVDVDDSGDANSQLSSNKERHLQDPVLKRQLRRNAKGTDRWPMLILNIDDHRQQRSYLFGDASSSGSGLQTILEVLETLMIEWLNRNGYRVQDRRQRRRKVAFGAGDEGSVDDSVYVPDSMDAPYIKPCSNVETTESPVRAPIVMISPRMLRTPLRTISNHESRIRSSKSFTPSGLTPHANTIPSTVTTRDISAAVRTPETTTNRESRLQSDHSEQSRLADDLTRPLKISDEICVWRDPVTQETHQINSRTGQAIMPLLPRDQPVTGIRSRTTNPSRPTNPITLSRTKKATALGTDSGEWLRNVMSDWTDPVFKQTESCIPRARTDLTIGEDRYHRAGMIGAKSINPDTRNMSTSRLSKAGLSSATVISQVDKKFLLIRMADAAAAAISSGDADGSGDDRPREVLVLIDQHAADERCRIEDLLRQLVLPPSNDADAKYQSVLGHRSRVDISVLTSPLIYEISAIDASRFVDEAARFARWGILYDMKEVVCSEPSITSESRRPQLVVQALPPVIAARCQADPKGLISLLREEIWREDRHHGHNHLDSLTDYDGTGGPFSIDVPPQHAWLSRLSDIPHGLLVLLNSRACRSAIMFNDALAIQECRDLVERLAKCAFPFQCAHGRPSMTPLVELGDLDVESVFADSTYEQTDSDQNIGFFQAWTKWKGR